MKLLLVVTITALMVGYSRPLPAQTPIAPGQIATAPRFVPPSGDLAEGTYGGVPTTTVASVEETPHDKFVNRLWIASIFAAVGATSLDAATSWGKREGNSLLASSDGTFGAKGLSIKAGLAAAVVILQICLRKHKDLKGAFTMGNFAEAGIYAGTSVHNLQVSSASAGR